MRFKLSALTMLAFSAMASAQTTTVSPNPVPQPAPLNLYKGSAKVSGPHTDLEACVKAAKTAGDYNCVGSTKFKVTIVPAPPPAPVPTTPPKPEPVSRKQDCPAGTRVGQWTQSAGYYAVPAPDYWALGKFQPETAPAADCPVVTTAPPPSQPPPPPPPPGPVQQLPTVNQAAIPTNGNAGSGARLIRDTGEMPYRDPDGMGAFRTVCQWSHFNFDDMLVFPGGVGKSHLHLYFGNKLSNALSTPESIRTLGNSTCRGGIVNRSSYWVPAMIDTRTSTPVTPLPDIDVYYKTGYGLFGQNDAVRPFPQGFRMIAGNSKSQVPQQQVGHFDCNGRITTGIPSDCTSGVLMHIVEFPSCWAAPQLTSPDLRSHVVYPSGGACPSTHPVHLPQVSYRVKYGPTAGNNSSTWRLSSDISNTPAGSSSHGDWVHGWEQEVMDNWVSRVIRRGLSGGSHIVGDGRVIY